MVKVLPEPVTPSSTCVRSWRCDALDQLGDRGRLVALRLVLRLHHEADAALGLLRPRRPVRRPDARRAGARRGTRAGPRAAACRATGRWRRRPSRRAQPAPAARAAPSCRDRPRWCVCLPPDSVVLPPPLWGRAREGGRSLGRGRRPNGWTPTPDPSPQGGGGRRRRAFITFVAFDAENPRQLRRGLAQLGVVAIGRLRHLAESARGRFARAVRGGEVGAAVARVVGRRLQAGLRADAGLAAIDRRVEQVGKRRRDRRQLRPRRFGAGRTGRVLGLLWLFRFVGGLGHLRNMGGPFGRGKGGGTAYRLFASGCHSRDHFSFRFTRRLLLGIFRCLRLELGGWG